MMIDSKVNTITQLWQNPKYRIGALMLLFFTSGGLDVKSILGLNIPISFVYFIITTIYTSKCIYVKFNELVSVSGAFFLLLFVYVMKGAGIPIWVLSEIGIGYLILMVYKHCPDFFYKDFSNFCKLCMYYTLIAAVLQYTLPSLITKTSFYRYSTILYLFWFTDGDNGAAYRFTGFSAEPGIWQIFICFNLYFSLYEKRSWKQILLSVISITAIYSTTGYLIMFFIFGYYYGVILRKIKITHILILTVVGGIVSDVFMNNITDKLSNSSGLTRISDIFIGWLYIKRSPLIGIDPSTLEGSADPEFLFVKKKIAEQQGGYASDGYMNSGLCSGIMMFILDYGLPIALYYYYKLFKFPLFKDTLFTIGFFIILLLTLMTEPMSRTGWFYFFILASFIKFNWKNTNYENINNNRNLQCGSYS